MSEDDPGRPTDTMFFCRIGTGFAIEVVVELFLIIAVARIYSVYGNLLTDSDAQCALKAGFSMFVIVLCIQLGVTIFDLIVIIAIVCTKAHCNCACYSLKVICHFCSFLGIVLGTMIYGIKDSEKVGWGFWMALAAGFFCCINGLMYFMTQQMRNYLQKSGVDMNTLDRGGKIE